MVHILMWMWSCDNVNPDRICLPFEMMTLLEVWVSLGLCECLPGLS